MDSAEMKPVALLLGRLGVGKSSLMKRLTGKHVLIGDGHKSVTTVVQLEITTSGKCFVVDTPGLEEDEDVARHMAGQLSALESLPLSSIIVVEELARAAVVVKRIAEMMNVVGYANKDLISVILTHADVKPGMVSRECRARIASMLCIRPEAILFSGLDTTAADTLNHVETQLLTSPRHIKLSPHQRSMLVSMAPIAQSVECSLVDFESRLACARLYIGALLPSESSDNLVLAITRTLMEQRDQLKLHLFQEVSPELKMDEQHVLFGKINMRLNYALDEAVPFFNTKMTRNPGDTTDPRNLVKICPHCQERWSKVDGCDGATTCGNRPTAAAPFVGARFKIDFIKRDTGAYEIVSTTTSNEPNGEKTTTLNGPDDNLKEAGTGFTSYLQHIGGRIMGAMTDNTREKARGCGGIITWSTMELVPPADLTVLANVDLSSPEKPEQTQQALFEAHVEHERVSQDYVLYQALLLYVPALKLLHGPLYWMRLCKPSAVRGTTVKATDAAKVGAQDATWELL